MDVSYIIDWISATNHGVAPNHFRYIYPRIQNIAEYERTKGLLGYDNVSKHRTGVLILRSTTRGDMGTHMIYSGKSLQRIRENYSTSAVDVLEYHVRNESKISRLDVAIDVFDSKLDIGQLKRAVELGEIDTTARKFPYIEDITSGAKTLYIGSMTHRKKLVRIYDKAKEQGDMQRDWKRIELEVHGKPAHTLAKSVVFANTASAIAGAIKGYVNFPKNPVWDKIFKDFESFKIGSQDSGDSDTRDWLLNSVAKTLAKMQVIDDSITSDFMESVMKHYEVMTRKAGKK